jgi:hypothetical protein
MCGGDGWIAALAATAAERFGWTWAEIHDGCPLAVLLLLTRQPGPWHRAPDGWGLDELDLLDWMAQTGTEPGGDMGGFFGAREGGGA